MNLRYRIPSIVIAVFMLLATGEASADSFWGTRSERVAETDHRIDVYLDYSHARLRVRRTVYNGGERPDEAVFMIDIPQGSAAVGLRTRGVWRGRARWFDGELMEAEAAAAKYRELTGIGGYYPKDPALLTWRDQGQLSLRVFPVLVEQHKEVEYTLLIPVVYQSGEYELALPPMGTEQLTAAWVVHPPGDALGLRTDARELTDGQEIPASNPLTLRWQRRTAPVLAGDLAVVRFGEGRVLTRYHLDVARRISAVPHRAKVVVVLDASRSLDEEMGRIQTEIGRAYLSHFPDAEVEVLTFARNARRRHGRFVDVATARADLAGLALAQTNGSAVDAALDRAAEILRGTPRHVARRVVLLTDLETRSTLDPEDLVARARRLRGVLHLAEVEYGKAGLERDDDSPWAAAPRATGGIFWRAYAEPDGDGAPKVYEEWARPVRIHHVRAEGLAFDPVVPDVLNEGDGISQLGVGNARTRRLRISGELWSKPIRRNFTAPREENRRWAALIFGTDLIHDLSEEEMMSLAMQGGAVSPVTSYLAIEPGVRPSTQGLEVGEGGLGLGSVGTGGGGSGSGSGVGFGRAQRPFDPMDFLQSELGERLERCGGAGRRAVVELENTREEIVDVTSVEVVGGDEAALSYCLREAVWRLQLVSRFSRYPRETWTVALDG